MAEPNDEPMYVRGWSMEDLLAARDSTDQVEISDQMMEKIKPVMFGRHPAVQMLTIMELAAMWASGWQRPMQRDMLDQLFSGAREMLGEINRRKDADHGKDT